MNSYTELKINKKEIIALLIVYLITAIYLLYFSPFCGRTVSHRIVQLVPFRTVLDQFNMHYGFDFFIWNIAGNILLLLPVGFALAILGWNVKYIKRVLLFVIVAISIELIQFIFKVGCLDIDDVWMNALGGLLGWRLGFRLKK